MEQIAFLVSSFKTLICLSILTWPCKCCFIVNTDFEVVYDLWPFPMISIKLCQIYRW